MSDEREIDGALMICNRPGCPFTSPHSLSAHDLPSQMARKLNQAYIKPEENSGAIDLADLRPHRDDFKREIEKEKGSG
ncbi:MAG: hypothetical protein LC778_19755 [Acidobacteria bacterium]|nr:hypothetical protein [Acidobacteriota bacterium]